MVSDGGLWSPKPRRPRAVESFGACWAIVPYGSKRAMVPSGTRGALVLYGYMSGTKSHPGCPVAQTRALEGPSQSHGALWHRGGAIPIPWCSVAQRRGHPNPMVPVCGKSLPASSCRCRTSCTSRHPAVNRALYKLFFHPALSSTTSLYKS